ncbi:UvrD-helicase domain-containing protein [Salegentibacter sp. F188]|uniref:DNA 3'-5' helicase n=1 Tax=Autumnicola patrickiae TaxID=3075591 RepID=A0ABU3E5N5_9FLAO|nr:UvrD-helicase domain-containing protein [Salegentibacter sp. F188]MDT0691306.1 UvrD-helicase domain-containing protein [Salegentibacter sp. F188]
MANSFTIYNASAGSGKTFTLVKEYLLLLFNSKRKDEYQNILAITFTNKAVDEMKSRIVDSLHAFSSEKIPAKSKGLFEVISKETGLNQAEIREKSAKILKSIIHNYAAFEVSTIDGFTHRVLRTFAKDLGLPINFEVEMAQEEILIEAVESVISKAGTDPKLTKILIDFTLNKADDDKSWDIARDLFEISKLLINENNQKPLELLRNKTLEDFEKFAAKLKSEIKQAKQENEKFASEFFELLKQNELEDSDFTRKSVPNHFKKLGKGESVNFETQWAEKIASGPLYPKACDASKKAIIDSIQPQIADLFAATKGNYFKVEFLEAVNKRTVQLSLLNAINQEIQAIKKDRNLVLISEFNPQISAQVKHQPAPFIYERLGERYNNYFIDEFQDTSQMQWENLIPLMDASLAGMGGEGVPANLMLVGDAKQSIYRWRGGKAENFIDLSNKKTRPFSIPQNVINLPANYRSGEEIVQFNNDFFGFAADYLSHPDYKDLFQKSSQEPIRRNCGYVNISLLEAENREEEFEVYPEKIMEIIQDLESKNFRKGDICILTRRKTEGIAIANHLSEHGISVVSSETLLISNSPEVNFIAGLLAFSINPEDDMLKMAIFDYLQKALQLENPHKIISANLPFNGNEFFSWLKNFDLDFDLENLTRLSLYEAAEYIIQTFELVKASDAYVQFFLDFIFENTQKSSLGISEFMDLWEREKSRLSILVPNDDVAVEIMTIHKAKGLEFPIVIYPFANSDFSDTKRDDLWLEMEEPMNEIPVSYLSASKKMLNWNPASGEVYQELLQQKELDTLNVLYVACTRASDQLYILTNFELDKKGISKTNKTSGLLIEFLRSKGLWNESKSYEFGKTPEITKERKSSTETISPERFYSSATQNQAVNIVTRSGSLWDTKQKGAIEKGEIAHEILAKINSVRDIDVAVENAVLDGIITENAAEEIKELVIRVCNHPQLKQYFSPGVQSLNERTIITAEEKVRPDRLVISQNKCTVIDYKTGNPAESHKNQINNYAEVLHGMGYEIEKKILVYVNEDVSPMFV